MVTPLWRSGAVQQSCIEVKERFRSGRGCGIRFVSARIPVEQQHGLRGVVAPDARKFGLIRERRHDAAGSAEHCDDEVEHRGRYVPKVRRTPEQREQLFTLLPRSDGRARAADGQHPIPAVFLVQAADEIIGQIIVADGLASGQRAVAEQTWPDSDLKNAVGRTMEYLRPDSTNAVSNASLAR